MKNLTEVLKEYSAAKNPATGVRVSMIEQSRGDEHGYGVIVEWRQSRGWFGSLRQMEFLLEYADGKRRVEELVKILQDNYPELGAHAHMCADRTEWKDAYRRNKAAMTRLRN